MEFEYVYQNCGEAEILERSLASIVGACVEGVNACLLTCGSSCTNRVEFTQGDTDQGFLGLSGSIIESLYEMLNDKQASKSSSREPTYSFFVRMSYFEFYEEIITDLLNPTNRHVTIAESSSKGRYIKNGTRAGPVRLVDDALEVLKQGRMARNTNDNAHGPAQDFTSSLLKIDLTQVHGAKSDGQTTFTSCLYIVDMPPTERLARSPASVRLAEGPILNKTLFAFDAVIKSLSRSSSSISSFAPYTDSHFTSLLSQPLGGNCITAAIVFVTENDYEGCKGSIEFAKLLQSINNYPVVNNEMMQGLQRHQNAELIFWREEIETLREEHRQVSNVDSDEIIRKVHELEGKLIRENLEKLRLKEEKEKIVRSMGEFRMKYQQLVETKAQIQQDLIVSEEEKLRISKTLLDIQLEKNELTEKAEQDKYDVVTKLLNAENDILELEMHQETKERKLKELEQQLETALEEKKQLAMEFVSLKSNFMNLNANHQREVAKNQQLGVELLTLANQRQSLSKQTDELEKFKNDMNEQQTELRTEIERLMISGNELKEKLRIETETSEKLRAEKSKAQLELQSVVVSFETRKLELDKNTQDFARERDTEMFSLKKTMENELKRVQTQRDEQVEKTKSLEASLRHSERQLSQIETALARQSEEQLELTAENAKLSEQLYAQQDLYRSKLLKYMDLTQTPESEQDETTTEPPIESEESATTETTKIDSMREELTHELVETFREKERENITSIDNYRRRNHEIVRKNRLLYEKFRELRYILQDMSPEGVALPDLPEETELKAGEVSELEAEIEKELIIMREKLRHVQSELSLQQEKNLQIAESYKAIVARLEKNNLEMTDKVVKLENERDRLENLVKKSTSGPDEATLDQMKKMQEQMLEKMQSSSQVENLKTECENLRKKLRENGNNQSGEELADAERRYAELMTKYVMAEQELETYKKHMKDTTIRLKNRITELEAGR